MAGFSATAPMGRYSVEQPAGHETWRGSTTFGLPTNNMDRALGSFDNAAVEASLAGGSQSSGSNSLSGFGLPPDVISDIIAKGNESINRSQDSALTNARGRAAGSGFSVGGGINKAEDTLLSDYASKRAGNERDVRIDAAKQALQDKMSQSSSVGGSGGGASRASGFSPAPQDGGLAEGINKGQQLSLMSSLLPRAMQAKREDDDLGAPPARRPGTEQPMGARGY